jgi:uncharacterized protein with PIN domain
MMDIIKEDEVFNLLREEYDRCIECNGDCSLRSRTRNDFDGYYKYVFVCNKCGVEYVDYFTIALEDDGE